LQIGERSLTVLTYIILPSMHLMEYRETLSNLTFFRSVTVL